MASLSNVIYYICENHPDGYNLSVERLIDMLYLVDWKYAIECRRQMTSISWEIRNSKPWMDESSVEELIDFLANLRNKSLIRTLARWRSRLSEPQKRIISFVIQTSLSKDEKELTQLVYSTYPAISQKVEKHIDFPDLAEEYVSKVKPLLGKKAVDI
jgi:hypothetical protein